MELHSVTFKAMGSPCELKLYAPPNKNIRDICQTVVDKILELENRYTRFKPTSITSRINQSAGSGEAVEVDGETAKLIDYAAILFEQSDGLFDVTSGVLRRAWNFKSNRLPTQVELEKILPAIGWQKVIWQSPFIQLPIKDMEIDFGGYVKEYAVDVAATLSMELGVQHGLVNLGGDVRIVGPHPDGKPWKVGIQHPRNPAGPIATVDMAHGAIATSGDYERFMIVDGVRYCHLLNPATGQSIQPTYASVSVIAGQCLVAGSFSTIAMLKSADDKTWLGDAGLPYLAIDRRMRASGTVDIDLYSPHKSS